MVEGSRRAMAFTRTDSAVQRYYLFEWNFRLYDENIFYQEKSAGFDILHYRALF